LASWLTVVPAARALPIQCDKGGYDVDLAVVHANGMFTSLGQAVANVLRLRPLVDQRLEQKPYTISYGVAYNEEKGVFDSIAKVVRERVPMGAAALVRVLDESMDLPDDVRDVLEQLATDVDHSGFQDDPSLDNQVQMYRELLRSGRKVLVVAHSEGNMYSNAAQERLFGSAMPEPGAAAFGIVGVATPTPSIAGWHPLPPQCPSIGCYTTVETDKIIGVVRKLLSDTAPANIFTKSKTADADGHGFIHSYLENAQAREQILDHMEAFVQQLGPLQPILTASLISAYLEWDSSADLDLHVFEANGREHVFTDHPDGSGHLDLDDVNGFGPEHYYAECDVLKGGPLRFGVGYFTGPGATTARLRVKVGDAVRTYTRTLPAPVGPSSLQTPETFVTAQVEPLPSKERTPEALAKRILADQYDVQLTEVPAPTR
jgi:hypothetical protein